MDIFFILLLILCIAIGFFQGMIRVTVAIVALYLALVLASLYYPVVGDFLRRRMGTQVAVGQYVAFAMVLFVAFIILLIAGIYTFRYAALPGRLQYLDRIFGTVLGLLLGAFMIGIFATFLWTLLVVRNAAPDLPLMTTIKSSTQTSLLPRYFANVILPQAYVILDPILPDGVRLIFTVQSS
jgi:membrane protein required for colicin V production